jgi:hypothetical protein
MNIHFASISDMCAKMYILESSFSNFSLSDLDNREK